VNRANKEDGGTALLDAAIHGNNELVKIMIEKKSQNRPSEF